MKYQVRVSRVYDSEAIEADNKTQAKEIYDKRKKRIKFFLIDEKLLDVTAVSHYEKPTCKIPEEYYKDVSVSYTHLTLPTIYSV